MTLAQTHTHIYTHTYTQGHVGAMLTGAVCLTPDAVSSARVAIVDECVGACDCAARHLPHSQRLGGPWVPHLPLLHPVQLSAHRLGDATHLGHPDAGAVPSAARPRPPLTIEGDGYRCFKCLRRCVCTRRACTSPQRLWSFTRGTRSVSLPVCAAGEPRLRAAGARALGRQLPHLFIRFFAMFYNVLWYVPFVRYKPEVRQRIQAGETGAIDAVWSAAPQRRTSATLADPSCAGRCRGTGPQWARQFTRQLLPLTVPCARPNRAMAMCPPRSGRSAPTCPRLAISWVCRPPRSLLCVSPFVLHSTPATGDSARPRYSARYAGRLVCPFRRRALT
jgi:hypothetical protein